MKMLAPLLLAFALCSSAAAQDNPTQPAAAQTAQTEIAPATTAAADLAPQAAGHNKVCRMQHGWTCHLHDTSLEPGSNCLCGDHHGTVDFQ